MGNDRHNMKTSSLSARTTANVHADVSASICRINITEKGNLGASNKHFPKFCMYCKNQGKSEVEYTSHFLREKKEVKNSPYTCPEILKIKCTSCEHQNRYCFGHYKSQCTFDANSVSASVEKSAIIDDSNSPREILGGNAILDWRKRKNYSSSSSSSSSSSTSNTQIYEGIYGGIYGCSRSSCGSEQKEILSSFKHSFEKPNSWQCGSTTKFNEEKVAQSLDHPKPGVHETSEELIKVLVKLVNGKDITLIVNSMDSIWKLKQKIKESEGFPHSYYRLYFNGIPLDDQVSGGTLLDYHIKNESILKLVLKTQNGENFAFLPSVLSNFTSKNAPKIMHDKFCLYCKNQGRNEEEYTSHGLRANKNDRNSEYTCPEIMKIECSSCWNHGRYHVGHYLTQCPFKNNDLVNPVKVDNWTHHEFPKFNRDKIIAQITNSWKYKNDPTYAYYQLSKDQIQEIWNTRRAAKSASDLSAIEGQDCEDSKESAESGENKIYDLSKSTYVELPKLTAMGIDNYAMTACNEDDDDWEEIAKEIGLQQC